MKNESLYQNNLIHILSYFLILLPIFLITGPFLSDLTVSILAISSFFFLRNKKYYNNYFFLIFILFWILILISSLLSETKILSLKSSFFYFRFCFFSLFIWWILEKNKNFLKKIYLVLFFSFLLIIFDSIFQYFNGYNIFNMKIIHSNRISSFFGDELKMGGFMMRLFPLLMALSFFFFKKKHEKYLFLWIILIIFVQLTIFLSGERTSFFLFNISIILFLLFLNNFNKTRISLLLIYLIAILTLFSIESPFKKRILNLTINQIQIDQSGKPKYIFSQQYHEHYLSAWKIFIDNKLLGTGPKSFREICKKKEYNFSSLTCSTHPHNIPLQLLAETGIFGFIFYLILNIIIWFNLFKNLFSKIFYKKEYLNNFQISLLINILILIWPLSPSGNLFNNWLSVIIYFPVGILLWELRKSKKMYLKSIKKKHFLSKFYFTN